MAATSLPSSMRAAQWTSSSGGLERNLKLNTEAQLPKGAKNLPKNSALIKVAYSSLNPVDYKVPEIPIVNNLVFTRPATPCLDYSGHIVASTIPELKAGDGVFGGTEPPVFGALGEYVVVPAKSIAKLPQGVSLRDAATIGVCGLTAYQCIAPYTKPGDKIFINGGSGGVGTYGIQIAKALGLHVTTSCSGANVELCKSLGADEVIDYRTNDLAATFKRNGTQFDHVFDTVLVDESLYWQCPQFLKAGGIYVTIAGRVEFWAIIGILKIFLIPGFLGGGQRKFVFQTANASAKDYLAVANMIVEGKLKPVIEKEFELEDAAKGFEHLKTGRTRGKLVVKVSGE